MEIENRKGMNPIPDNLEELLNEAQLRALRSIIYFELHLDWQLHFIRRPLFHDVVPVLISSESGKFAVLGANGSINVKEDLGIRDCTPAPELTTKIIG